jgi:hypothetical protein
LLELVGSSIPGSAGGPYDRRLCRADHRVCAYVVGARDRGSVLAGVRGLGSNGVLRSIASQRVAVSHIISPRSNRLIACCCRRTWLRWIIRAVDAGVLRVYTSGVTAITLRDRSCIGHCNIRGTGSTRTHGVVRKPRAVDQVLVANGQILPPGAIARNMAYLNAINECIVEHVLATRVGASVDRGPA